MVVEVRATKATNLYFNQNATKEMMTKHNLEDGIFVIKHIVLQFTR